MHLLGTSVLVFLLLPLVLSCESTNPKEAISEAYKNIIQKQLKTINLSIESKMNGSCGQRKPAQKKNISDQLQSELRYLRGDINASLGCNCPVNQTKHPKWPQCFQKKLCRLQRLLMMIQNAYEQHNSAL